MYGYIYKTTNKINNMIYVGQKKAKKFVNYYKGSGKYLRRAINAYGKDNFITEILETIESDNQSLMDEREQYWIKTLDATNKNIGYNIANGGLTSCSMSGEHNPMYGKHHSGETRKLIGDKQRECQAKYGNPAQNSEVGKKISEKLKGHTFSEKTREKISNTLKGKSYLTEEGRKRLSELGKNRRHTEEELKVMSSKLKGQNNPMYGKMWINNGMENTFINKDDPIPEGYVKGFIKNIKKHNKEVEVNETK